MENLVSLELNIVFKKHYVCMQVLRENYLIDLISTDFATKLLTNAMKIGIFKWF